MISLLFHWVFLWEKVLNKLGGRGANRGLPFFNVGRMRDWGFLKVGRIGDFPETPKMIKFGNINRRFFHNPPSFVISNVFVTLKLLQLTN